MEIKKRHSHHSEFKKIMYGYLWKFFDNLFDLLIIIAICITAFAGAYELLSFIIGYDLLPWWLNIATALKISLNAVVIVKVYETLRMFISHEDLSLTHLIEVGLIGLIVKIFFNESYLRWEYSIIFIIFFLAYFILKRWRHKLECEHFEMKKTLPERDE